jgi:hypothetical protein
MQSINPRNNKIENITTTIRHCSGGKVRHCIDGPTSPPLQTNNIDDPDDVTHLPQEV